MCKQEEDKYAPVTSMTFPDKSGISVGLNVGLGGRSDC